MREFYIDTAELCSVIPELCFGDFVFLSGTVYTARDAAHKKICEIISNGGELPFDLKGAAVYYAGPTPTPEHLAIGSCGPTTSCRMDKYAPILLNRGLACMIGKGGRNDEVVESIKKNGAVYLCAIGGAGAVASKCITSCEVIAFPELGCESVKRLTFKDFPLIVGIDQNGGSIYSKR